MGNRTDGMMSIFDGQDFKNQDEAAIEWYAGAIYESREKPVATFKRDNRVLTLKRDDAAGVIILHAAGE